MSWHGPTMEVSARDRTKSIGMNSCDDVSHTVSSPSSGRTPGIVINSGDGGSPAVPKTSSRHDSLCFPAENTVMFLLQYQPLR